MRLAIALLLCTISAIFAEDFVLTDGTTITGNLSRSEPDGLVITTEDGIQKIPFVKLPEHIQKQYGYDPAKAEEFRSKIQSDRRAAVNNIQKVQSAAAAEYNTWEPFSSLVAHGRSFSTLSVE